MWQKFFLALCIVSSILLVEYNNTSGAAASWSPWSDWFRGPAGITADKPIKGRRVALVIGNGEYQDRNWPKLRNPTHDAEDLTAALRRLGFTVVEHTNLGRIAMRSAIAEFGRTANRAEVALFFFAGHGIQSRNRNFLMPVDVTASSLADATDQGINVNFPLEELEIAKSRVNIVMLDACRENPYGAFRGGTPGLAPLSAPRATVIVYSTGPGKVAADGVSGARNSPFTGSLLTALTNQDLTLGGVLKRTSQQVEARTRGRQSPYVNGPRSLDDFLLAGELHEDDTAAKIQAEEARLAELKRQREAEEARLAKLRRAAEEARKTTRHGRYLLSAAGVATDTETGLMWQRCAVGQTWTGSTCSGTGTDMTWDVAMPGGEQKRWPAFAGHSDWRVPDIKELRTLVYCSSGKPATWNKTNKEYFSCKGDYQRPTIDTTAFPKTGFWFWSAAALASGPSYAWSLGFSRGHDLWLERSRTYRVRLVRAGQ